MTTILIDALLIFWLLIFGGIALLPVLTGSTSARQQPSETVEDRVISIAPARPANRPQGQRTPLLPRNEHPNRPAA